MKQDGRSKDKEYKKKYRKDYYHSRPEYWKERHIEYVANNTEKYLFKVARNRAKKTGLEFNIDLEDIIIPEKCPYLNEPLTRDYGNGRTWYNPSLDRIDNTKGYIKGNVQIISDRANRMKVDSTVEELLKFAEGIIRMHGAA